MNKPKFKCLMSLLCSLQGIVLIFLALLLTTLSSTTHILLLAFGCLLIVIGGIAFIIYYKNVKIIAKLKNNDLPLLASWTYHPSEAPSIYHTLLEEKQAAFSVAILLTTLLILLDLGFILTNPNSYLLFALIAGGMIICFTFCLCLGLQLYYNSKLSHPIAAIIGLDYIYFCGELYGLNRSIYSLAEVSLLEGQLSYLQFIYGTPGTPYDPVHIVTLPVATSDLPIAYKIKSHYSKRLAE